MATAAELVMAPGAARPETAGARKDAPAAAGETSFADVLDAEVQTTTNGEASDANAAAATQITTPTQAQPAPAPATTSAADLLISLQPAAVPDGSAVQPGTATAPAANSTPAIVPDVSTEAPVAASAPAAPASLPQVAQPALPQTPADAIAAPPAATAAVAVASVAASVLKAPGVTTEAKDTASEGDAALTPAPSNSAKGVAVDTAAQPTVVALAEAPATPAGQVAAAPIEAAALALAPKPAPPGAPQPTSEASTGAQPVANAEAPGADASTQTSKAGPDTNAASSSSTAACNAKSQTNTLANAKTASAPETAPEAKASTPMPAPNTTATSLADMLAAGRGTADAGKTAPAHQAMQSAPQAVVQVYTRFVERFDGRAQRFEVRLDPAELGRVDVRIEIGADKKVHAVLAAHDSAALSDLMRGQRALERALADAGIDLKDGGVKFELANDSGRGLAGQEQRRDARPGEDTNVWRGFSTVDVAAEAEAPAALNFYRRATRLDLVA